MSELNARRERVTSLRARARLRAGLRSAWTRQAILVRRPDAVRVDILSPFGLVLALGTRDAFLWAYPPGEGTRYEGPATPSNVTRFLGAPVSVPDMVDVLLGLPPARPVVDPPQLEVTRNGEYRLTLPSSGRTQTIWFAGDTLAVRRAEEATDGTVTLRLAFDDYKDGFPYAVDIEAPGGSAAARLAYDRVEPNVPLDNALFAPPNAARVLPIDAVRMPTPE